MNKYDENYNPNPPELTSPVNLRTERLTICSSCTHYTSIKFCDICNCFMPVKTYWISAKCPENMW